MTATYNEGVLTVTVPIHERAQPRKIDISRAESQPQQVIDGTSTQSAVGAGTGTGTGS